MYERVFHEGQTLMRQHPMPDGRARDVLGMARGFGATPEGRRNLIAALDSLEVPWATAILRLDANVLARLPQQSDDLNTANSPKPEHDPIDTVVEVARELAARYELPAVSVGLLAMALALTARVDHRSRVVAAHVMADCFEGNTFENLDSVLGIDDHPDADSASETEMFLSATPVGQAADAIAGKLFSFLRIGVTALAAWAIFTSAPLWLLPLTLSMWVQTRHPADCPQTIQQIGPIGTRVWVTPVNWSVISAASFAVLGRPGLALIVVGLFALLEFISAAGELIKARGLRAFTDPPHPFALDIAELPSIVVGYEAEQRLVRILVGYLAGVAAATWLVLAAGPVNIGAVVMVFVGTAMAARCRLFHAAFSFAAVVFLTQSIVVSTIPLALGAGGACVLLWRQRLPDAPVPVPRIPMRAVLSESGRRLRRGHRLLRRGMTVDAMLTLRDSPFHSPKQEETAALLCGWAHLQDEHPDRALAAVSTVGEFTTDGDVVHRRAIRCLIEVEAHWAKIDPDAARFSAGELIEYRSRPRCELTILRHCLVTEARLLAESDRPWDREYQLSLVHMLVQAVPAHVTSADLLLFSRMQGRIAECLLGVSDPLAIGILTARFTSIGTTATGLAKDFQESHCMADFVEEDDEDHVVIQPLELNSLRERIYLYRARKLIDRPIPEYGRLSDLPARRMAARLEQYENAFAKRHRGPRAALSQCEGYLSSLKLLDDNDYSNGLLSLMRSMIADVRDKPMLEDNPRAGRVLAVLGRVNVRFSRYDLAVDAFARAARSHGAGPESDQAWICAVFADAHAAEPSADADPAAQNFLKSPGPDVAATRRLRSAIRGHTVDDPGRIVNDLLAVRSSSVIAYFLAMRPVTALLCAAGHRDVAIGVLDAALRWGVEHDVDLWIMAPAQVELAAVVIDTEPDRALDLALAVWHVREESLFSGCSEHMRRTVDHDLGRVRDLTLTYALTQRRFDTVAALIEHARMEASLFATLHRDHDWSDTVRVQVHGDADPDSTVFSIPGDLDPRAPAAIGVAVEDAVAATTITRLVERNDVRRPAVLADQIIAQLDRHDIDCWLSFAVLGTGVIWSFCDRRRQFTGGFLRDHDYLDLVDSLGALRRHARREGPELREALVECDSDEELAVTLPLAALLPRPVIAALNAIDGRFPTLALAFPPDLAVVPWPIIPVHVRGGTRRLVELADLRVWNTVGVESRRRDPVISAAALHLAVCCNDPTGTLRSGAMDFEPFFTHRLGSAAREDIRTATKSAVLESLSQIYRENQTALAFFRTHSKSAEDPSQSELCLADDEGIAAGELFGRYGHGMPYIPMPYRVVLSSCASASVLARGGSSLGLAGGCLTAGAAGVIATGIVVYDSTFTLDLDHRLIGVMRSPGRHDLLLSGLHRELLEQWRQTPAPGIDTADDITYPHPLIWAYYWAF
ncbi:hypothetical protein [Nocardia salmonicida]|uniref:hypothetical protein n=1 Tax=Nocardia salmonicida TaxID=53431 RepID=UPI0037946037